MRLDAAVGKIHRVADGLNIASLQALDQGGKRDGCRLRVGIENPPGISGWRCCDTLIDPARVAIVGRRLDDLYTLTASKRRRESIPQGLIGLLAAILADDDFKVRICAFGDRANAAVDVCRIVVTDDGDRDV